MLQNLKEEIMDWSNGRVAVIGFAPVDRFAEAPPKHHPGDVCREAKTVVVLGLPTPKGVLTSPTYHLHGMHRSYHTLYRRLDELSVELCGFIESRGAYHAAPVPCYAPMVFHWAEPWGILSLKHAAVKAGLGLFGRSGQVYHPRYGALLRFGAVVTDAQMPGEPLPEEDPCPPRCNICRKVCPAGAFDDSGEFNKMVCLGHTIKHAIYPLALKSEEGLRNIERVINTAGHDYWISCNECVKHCPKNK